MLNPVPGAAPAVRMFRGSAGGVRVRTPMLYPDGGVVDVFVLERGSGYAVTDFGDALGWLWLQSISRRRSPRQDALLQEVCQTLRINLDNDQLVARAVTPDALGEAVLRVAQAAVRLSEQYSPPCAN